MGFTAIVLDRFTAYGVTIPDSFSPQAMAQTMPTSLGFDDEEDGLPPKPQKKERFW